MTDSSPASSRRIRSASAQRFGQPHARQQPHDGGGSADHARQHAVLPSASMCPPACSSEMRPTGSDGQHTGHFIEFVDTQRFEIVAERRFDGAFPAAVHRQLRGEPRLLAEPGGGQPFGRARIAALQRRLLQRFERNDFRATLFAIGARVLEILLGIELRGAQFLRAIERLVQRLRQFIGGAARQRIPSRRAARAAPRIPAPSALRARPRGGRPGRRAGATGFPAARCARVPPAWSGARRPARD